MGLLDSLRTRVGYYLDPPLTYTPPSTPKTPALGTLFDPPFKIGAPTTQISIGGVGIRLANDPNSFGTPSSRVQIQAVNDATVFVGTNGIIPNNNSTGYGTIIVPSFYAVTLDTYGQSIMFISSAVINLVWLLPGQDPQLPDGPLTQP
jgi:hypothetical protein